MTAAIISMTILGLMLGFGLGYAAKLFKVEADPIVEKIAVLMPGANCGQCGFPGCNAAAEAIASGNASPACCPPGGRSLAEELAALVGVSLDASNAEEAAPKVAVVNESRCVGCAKCLKHCPTDALIGAPRQIHVVIRDACIGCSACVQACPYGTLSMQEVETTLKTWRWKKPEAELGLATAA